MFQSVLFEANIRFGTGYKGNEYGDPKWVIQFEGLIPLFAQKNIEQLNTKFVPYVLNKPAQFQKDSFRVIWLPLSKMSFTEKRV